MGGCVTVYMLTYDRLASSSLICQLVSKVQYVILLSGLVAAACLCGTLGIIAAFLVFNFKVFYSLTSSSSSVPILQCFDAVSWLTGTTYSFLLQQFLEFYFWGPA